jgi:hypothetical protein
MCRYTEYCYPERRYAKCLYAECRYAKWHYAECHGALKQASTLYKYSTVVLFRKNLV